MKRRVAEKILKNTDKLNYSKQQIEKAAKKLGEKISDKEKTEQKK